MKLRSKPTIFSNFWTSERYLATRKNDLLPKLPVFKPNWNETLKTNMSTKADASVKPNIASKEISNTKDFGRRQQKIEVDGMMLNWDIFGTGEHVLLLLPGVIGSIQTDFGPIVHKFDSTKYTIVSWDPPGYGLSRPPNRDFSGVYLRRDGHTVVKLMSRLGFDKYSILGWSNGGNTGGYVAADYPSKIQKLVTWGSQAYLDERAVKTTKILGNLDIWHPKMLEPLIAMYGKEYLVQLLQNWHIATSELYHTGLHTTFKECLPNITCPALAIHGENDPILGVEQAEYLLDHIANSKIWIIPKAQHNMHLRHSDEFLRVVTEFLDS